MLLCRSNHSKSFHSGGSGNLIHFCLEEKPSSWASKSFSPARNRERGTCLLAVPPADTFVGLSFEAGAEIYGKENDWVQKTEGEERFLMRSALAVLKTSSSGTVQKTGWPVSSSSYLSHCSANCCGPLEMNKTISPLKRNYHLHFGEEPWFSTRLQNNAACCPDITLPLPNP